MATLKRFHDISDFTSPHDHERAGRTSHIRYDADLQRLMASDGRVAIAVPVEGNSLASGLYPCDAFKQVGRLKPGATLEAKGTKRKATIGDSAIAVEDGRYPDVSKVVSSQKRYDTLLCVDPEVLLRVAQYAKRNGVGGLYFAFRHDGAERCDGVSMVGAKEIDKVNEQAVRFFFVADEDQDQGTLVSGVFMPVSIDADDGRLARKMLAATTAKAAAAKRFEAEKIEPDTPATAGKSKPTSQSTSKPAAPSKAASARTAQSRGTSAAHSFDDLLKLAAEAIKNAIAESSPGHRASARRRLNAASGLAKSSTEKAAIEKLETKLAAIPTTTFKNRG